MTATTLTATCIQAYRGRAEQMGIRLAKRVGLLTRVSRTLLHPYAKLPGQGAATTSMM
ncbi:MAG: hypothetical protein KDH96_08945 [Candidatus Riesia sp.]|nr:hypothetical protein [Candidatus Riesia sp.]